MMAREGLRLDSSEGSRVEVSLIPEAVAISRALKLLFDDRPKKFTDLAAVDVILDKASDEHVEVVGRGVGEAQSSRHLRVRGHFGEGRLWGQPVIDSRLVVTRKANVASALDIQCDQVEAIKSLDNETPNRSVDVCIDFLRLLFGEAAQIGLDSRSW